MTNSQTLRVVPSHRCMFSVISSCISSLLYALRAMCVQKVNKFEVCMHNFCGCGLFFNFYRKAEDHTRSQKCAVLLLVVASTCKPTSKSGGVVSKKKYEATSKCSETPHCSETPAPTLPTLVCVALPRVVSSHAILSSTVRPSGKSWTPVSGRVKLVSSSRCV